MLLDFFSQFFFFETPPFDFYIFLMLCIADVASKRRVGGEKNIFLILSFFLHNFALTYTTAFYWWRVVDAEKKNIRNFGEMHFFSVCRRFFKKHGESNAM